MTQIHDGLPVHGYRPQSGDRVALVNANKDMEERVLRLMDELALTARPGDVDGRWFAIARSHFDQGWMALNRAIFQPVRISLPEDGPPLPHPIPEDGG